MRTTYCSRRTGLRVRQNGLLAEAGTERLNGGLSGTGKRTHLESRVRIGRSAPAETGDVERSRIAPQDRERQRGRAQSSGERDHCQRRVDSREPD